MTRITRKKYAALTSIAFLAGNIIVSALWFIGFYLVNHTWENVTSLHNISELVLAGIYGGYACSSVVAGLIWFVCLSAKQSLWGRIFLLILFVAGIKWVFLISFYLAGFVYLYNLLQMLQKKKD